MSNNKPVAEIRCWDDPRDDVFLRLNRGCINRIENVGATRLGSVYTSDGSDMPKILSKDVCYSYIKQTGSRSEEIAFLQEGSIFYWCSEGGQIHCETINARRQVRMSDWLKEKEMSSHSSNGQIDLRLPLFEVMAAHKRPNNPFRLFLTSETS